MKAEIALVALSRLLANRLSPLVFSRLSTSDELVAVFQMWVHSTPQLYGGGRYQARRNRRTSAQNGRELVDTAMP